MTDLIRQIEGFKPELNISNMISTVMKTTLRRFPLGKDTRLGL